MLSKIQRDMKGITLIALVITIIVLLILAGVSIATLTGENGILTRATQAKEDTTKEGAREKLSLILNELQTEKIPKGESLALGDALASEIGAFDEVTSATYTGQVIEVVIDGYTFEVNGDLGIENKKEIAKVEPENINDWEWIEKDGYLLLTSYKGNDTKVVIPNYINGKWVKGILSNEKTYGDIPTVSFWGENICEYVDRYASWGFYVQNTIKEIIISEGIIMIGERAFMYTRNLEKVEIPRSVIHIGREAFDLGTVNGWETKDENKLTTVNLYNNIETMGIGAFTGRGNITLNLEYSQEEMAEITGWDEYWYDPYDKTVHINYGVQMD